MNRREFLETIPLLTITGLAAYRLIEPQTSNDPSMPTMETINYKKQKVNFIGVRHTQETLDKHSTFIEESIKNSNVILLEKVPYIASYPGIVTSSNKIRFEFFIFSSMKVECLSRVCFLF